MSDRPELVNWPETLVSQIIARRWILFIGSGVSATCVNDLGNSPPNWKALLEGLAAGIGDEARRGKAQDLIASNRYLQAAEHVRWCYRVGAKNADFLAKIREAVQGPTGHSFEPSGVYPVLLDLDPTTVITTNYDRLFEIASKGAFDALSYDDDAIAANVRKGQPVLLKLHGRVDEMQRIVLTRQDYLQLKRTGAHALDTLRSLFQTHTTLFVGYSIEDPDVQLLLEAGAGYCDPESHYLLTRASYEDYEIETFREYYGVSVLRYDRTASLEAVLSELRDLVVGAWTADVV